MEPIPSIEDYRYQQKNPPPYIYKIILFLILAGPPTIIGTILSNMAPVTIFGLIMKVLGAFVMYAAPIIVGAGVIDYQSEYTGEFNSQIVDYLLEPWSSEVFKDVQWSKYPELVRQWDNVKRPYELSELKYNIVFDHAYEKIIQESFEKDFWLKTMFAQASLERRLPSDEKFRHTTVVLWTHFEKNAREQFENAQKEAKERNIEEKEGKDYV